MIADTLLPIFKSVRFWLITLAISFFATIITFLLTGPFFITPKYTSESVFFVPLTLLSKHIEQQGIGFAGDVEIDAHIQILKSRALKDSLINAFPILKSGSENPFDLLDKLVIISKTKYGSVSVAVTHQDRLLAAELANAVVRLGDVIKASILHKNRLEMFTYYKDMYTDLEIESQLLEKQLDSINENKQGNTSSAYKINSLFVSVVGDLNHYKSQYAKQKKGLETPLPQSYVISIAAPASKPAYPNRIIMAGLAGLFGLLLCLSWATFSK
jgi:uncharacterized protein involved in exopolysaccharide biosynthesis